MSFFVYFPDDDTIHKIATRSADAQWGDSDAGMTYYPFIVDATNETVALEAARRWCACWADEEESCVPDDLALVEREGSRRPYMILSA